MKANRYIADFDSAAAMVRMLARFLHGRGFPMLGVIPPWGRAPMRLLGAAVNRLPARLREQVYIWSGWYEAIRPARIAAVDEEAVASWVVEQYPRRRYPAVAVGSSNGALVHLWAALGIPWLPQTVLVPVARGGMHPDEPGKELGWAQTTAGTLLARNPSLQLHHMHDPVQDRLMIRRMGYFRLKRRRLGAAYERFLREVLEPGGSLLVVDCGLRWPVQRRGERHVFQFGALGGATIDELFRGGPRVRSYLARYGSPYRQWSPPEPDEEAPEAEWGFEPALGEDVQAFARAHGYRCRQVSFTEPEDVSPLVADLHGWWYERLGRSADRLLIESFIVMEPYWTLQSGAVPFWMVFNTEGSAEAAVRYLDSRPPFEEIGLMLFSHGVESVGLVPIAQWRSLLRRAARRGVFLGVDPEAYPRDFAVFTRYHAALRAAMPARPPSPPPLTLAELQMFLAQHGQRYPVEWRESTARGRGAAWA